MVIEVIHFISICSSNTIEYNKIFFFNSLSSSTGKHEGNINKHVVRKKVIKDGQLIHNSRLVGYEHGRKHCVKRRKRWLAAFSPFSAVFSEALIFRVINRYYLVNKISYANVYEFAVF